MIAARLLPIAVAVVLSLHARFTLAFPVNNEDIQDLSLRSVSVANDDASTLTLREPSEEDELLDLVQRTPQAKGLLDLINRLPGINKPPPIEELAIRTIEDEIIEELLHRGYYDDMDLD
ncbi:hypothetical protein H1R20_g7933, partial [Candolleomyces eurysporus]